MARKCHRCGAKSLEYIPGGTLTQDDPFVATVTVHDVPFEQCSECGYKLFTPESLDALLSESKRKLTNWLDSQPVDSFYTREETCEVLGISKQAISKNQKIKRGFIFRILKGNQHLYLKKSAEQYKSTGDGRFSIAVHETDALMERLISPERITPEVWRHGFVPAVAKFPRTSCQDADKPCRFELVS